MSLYELSVAKVLCWDVCPVEQVEFVWGGAGQWDVMSNRATWGFCISGKRCSGVALPGEGVNLRKRRRRRRRKLGGKKFVQCQNSDLGFYWATSVTHTTVQWLNADNTYSSSPWDPQSLNQADPPCFGFGAGVAQGCFACLTLCFFFISIETGDDFTVLPSHFCFVVCVFQYSVYQRTLPGRWSLLSASSVLPLCT